MATDIVMPKLSDTMTEGKFGTWKKGVGDKVQRGEVIAEVETDKAVMDLEAFSSGILLEQRVHDGDVVAVGSVIGRVGLPEEATAADGRGSRPLAPIDREGIGPERVMEAEKLPATALQITEPGVAAATTSRHDEQAAPIVRRKAREMGIDLSLVQGSGPGGRILPEDLERFAGVSMAPEIVPLEEPAELKAPPDEPPITGQLHKGEPPAITELPISRMRGAIARSVEKAWREIPHFTVSVDLSMDAAEEVRTELKEGGTAISVNDMVIKGAALALRAFPMVNASFAGDRIIMPGAINIGIAVSLPEGLLVPVLRGCETLSLKEIAFKSRQLIERARSGQLSETELSGGTFSISNLGMYGVTSFSAVIHPSQGAILAVGGVRQVVGVKNCQPCVCRTMNLTLSADHRLIDGSYAAEFLGELRHNLETPVRLLI
jgi:pyruvate dehydrogenase E2 component (dihydrolipoamide acetyltransferase)